MQTDPRKNLLPIGQKITISSITQNARVIILVYLDIMKLVLQYDKYKHNSHTILVQLIQFISKKSGWIQYTCTNYKLFTLYSSSTYKHLLSNRLSIQSRQPVTFYGNTWLSTRLHSSHP